jgi:putative ABC transport system ATP-binding protein
MADGASDATTVVRATGLSHTFGRGETGARALDDVSIEVAPGQLVLVTGPSGSGKTTLVSILAGLLRPSRGRVELCGETITDRTERDIARVRRRGVGFVFQAFHLFPALTALDNVAEVLALRGGLPLGRARDEARAALERVGLGARTHALPSELSAGQKQRVAVARALAGAPALVVGDEPTAALDGETAFTVMRLLRAHVGPRSAVVVVTHDHRLERYADRVLALEDGRVIRDTQRATEMMVSG